MFTSQANKNTDIRNATDHLQMFSPQTEHKKINEPTPKAFRKTTFPLWVFFDGLHRCSYSILWSKVAWNL